MIRQPPVLRATNGTIVPYEVRNKAQHLYSFVEQQLQFGVDTLHRRFVFHNYIITIGAYKNKLLNFTYGTCHISPESVDGDIECNYPIISALIGTNPLDDQLPTIVLSARVNGISTITTEIYPIPTVITDADPLLNYMYDNKAGFVADWQMNIDTCNTSWAGEKAFYWGEAYAVHGGLEILTASIAGDKILIAAYDVATYDIYLYSENIRIEQNKTHLVGREFHIILWAKDSWDSLEEIIGLNPGQLNKTPIYGEAAFNHEGTEFKTQLINNKNGSNYFVEVEALSHSETLVWASGVHAVYNEDDQIPSGLLYTPAPQKDTDGDTPRPIKRASLEPDEADFMTTAPFGNGIYTYTAQGSAAGGSTSSSIDESILLAEFSATIESDFARVNYHSYAEDKATRTITGTAWELSLPLTKIKEVQGNPPGYADYQRHGYLDGDVTIVDMVLDSDIFSPTYGEYFERITELRFSEWSAPHASFIPFGYATTDILSKVLSPTNTVYISEYFVRYFPIGGSSGSVGEAYPSDRALGYFKDNKGLISRAFNRAVLPNASYLVSYTPPSGYSTVYIRYDLAANMLTAGGIHEDVIAAYPPAEGSQEVPPVYSTSRAKFDTFSGDNNITNLPQYIREIGYLHAQSHSVISLDTAERNDPKELRFYQITAKYTAPAIDQAAMSEINGAIYRITPLSTRGQVLFSANLNHQSIVKSIIKSSDLTYSLELDENYSSSPYTYRL